ncbi:hypothetical protein Nepgr_005328 [Nepenthes gracilis]|uniref:Uncharacterized protein n=1 Tax=Nepenthes gracilis TaxID=150966 RepID=A0AAD3S3G4_NEPGR|nr:hypothetical protein Nepgr_005328 [Nepenthes gracilis]
MMVFCYAGFECHVVFGACGFLSAQRFDPVSRGVFLMLNLELTFSFEVMFPADVFLSGHVNGGLERVRFFAPRCLCRFCCEAFYVAEANVAAHGLNSTIVLLSGHVKGGPALLPMGFAGCSWDGDSFEISGTSLADRCCFDGNFLIVQLISLVLCAPCFGCFG